MVVIRERRAPKFSHQSQGSVEATIRHCRGHFRTLRSALENGTGLEHMTLLLGWYDTLVG